MKAALLFAALLSGGWVHASGGVRVPGEPDADFGELGVLFDNSAARREEAAVPVIAPMQAAQVPLSGPILHVEEGPLPAVPRLRLDPAAIPPHLRSMISGFERLPHKNQEETEEWVAQRNALIRRRNARPGARRMPEWTYNPKPTTPPFSCLSFAASTVYDWWALEMGRGLQGYENKNNGRPERGLDPYPLELEYFTRADPREPYYMLVPREFGLKDPVRQVSAPAQPLGYAELLTGPGFRVRDPLTGETLRFEPEPGVMEGQYVMLFTNRLLRARTPDKYARVLAEAIDKWGIAYVQMEDTNGSPRLIGAHVMSAVGYLCMETAGERFEEQRLVPCSANRGDEDWGRTAWFVMHDSFGGYPADHRRDAVGASAYRALRIADIDQAIVFPHSLALTAVPAGESGWSIGVANKSGRPVEVLSLRAGSDGGERAVEAVGDGFLVRGRPMESIRIRVEARHYYEADGGPREFSLDLDPARETQGREIVRTPPSPTYQERTGR